MKNDLCIQELQEKLDRDGLSVEPLLRAVCRCMAEELIERGSVCLKGVGCFEVTEQPPVLKDGQLLPPASRLRFHTRPVNDDELSKLVGCRAGISPVKARNFMKALGSCLEKAVRARRELRLRGIGVFCQREGRYLFVPDDSFEELLNAACLHLTAIDIEGR